MSREPKSEQDVLGDELYFVASRITTPSGARKMAAELHRRGWQLARPELHSAPLNRLADLTEAAGKARSTEWLRTCATLPVEEWPPAPAYKGPMVPAAERDRLADACREYETQIQEWREEAESGGDGWGMFRTRQALGTPDGRAVSVHAAEVRAELDWRRLRMDEVLAEIDNYDGPTDPAELPEDSEGRNILDRIRALMHGDQPTREAS